MYIIEFMTNIKNPIEDIKPFAVLIDESSVNDAIRRKLFEEQDKLKINFQNPYIVTKRHFVGNAAIDYDYYIPKIDLWIYDFCLEPRSIVSKKEFRRKLIENRK
jgi:hypothetical protein